MDDGVVQPQGPVEWGGETRARILRSPGGSAANQAAWLGALGADVRFAGRVGADDVGRHSRELRRHGVDARLTADPVAPTGTVLVLVGPDGERDMYVDPGANRNLAVADLAADLLDAVDLVHLSGYSFFQPGPRAAVTDLTRRAGARGIAVSIDPASATFLREVGARAFLDWTRGIQVIFPNLDEGRVLTGHAAPEGIVDALVARYPIVVLTLGAAGVLAATDSGSRVRRPAMAVPVADTTGAGDAFCAGFLAAWIARTRRGRAMEMPNALEMPDDLLTTCVIDGQTAATRVVGRLGGRPPTTLRA